MSKVGRFFSSIFNYIRNHKKRSIIIGIIVVLLIIVLRPKQAPVIETQEVQKGDVTQALSVSGTVSSEHIANLSFLISSKLVTMNVKKGDYVKKGQVIATLDMRSVQKNIENSLLDYSEQRNTFDQTNEDNKNRVLSDNLRRIYENNQSDLTKAVNSVELQTFIKDQSVLTSPIAGYVVRTDVDTPGLNVSPTTIFTVADLDNLRFNMDVDEADIGKVQEGMNVSITLDAFSDKEIGATVSSIDYASHTTSTGGTAYTVSVDLPTDSQNQYRIGMNGDADIVLAQHKDVLQIPITAIVDGKNVLVKNKDNSIEQREVGLGLQSDTTQEVTSGLSIGEQVVVQPIGVAVTKKSSTPFTFFQKQ